MTFQPPKASKDIIILWHNGGRLANQLWLYISVFAYCAEKGYGLHNYAFFEYADYFNIQSRIPVVRFFILWPYRLLRSVCAVFIKRPDKLSTYLFRKYYQTVVGIFSLFVKKHTVRADSDSSTLYLPPSAGAFPRFTDFDINNAHSLYLVGWLFRNPVGIAKYREEIVTSFKPRLQYCEKAEVIVSALRKKFKRVVGVHIRQGDYVQRYCNGSLHFSEKEVGAFCLELLERFQLSATETGFIVCSDGPIAEQEFPDDLQVTVSNNSEIVDLLVLASCDYILGSNSTFGGFASYFGDKPLIVFRRGGIDWDHYTGRAGFFVDPYLTSVHF